MILEVKRMYKEYLRDLFTEGLGDIFFMKYYNYVKENVKNKKIKKLLIGIYGFIYIIFLIVIAVIIFKLSFPI